MVVRGAHEISEIIHAEDPVARQGRIQEIAKRPLQREHHRQEAGAGDYCLDKFAAFAETVEVLGPFT